MYKLHLRHFAVSIAIEAFMKHQCPAFLKETIKGLTVSQK